MILHQTLIPLDENEAWDRVLEGVPHGVCHTQHYNRAMTHTHAGEVFLYHAWDDLGFETICPIKVRQVGNYRDISTPYGLSGFSCVGSSPIFDQEWMKFSSEQGWICAYIAQHPHYTSPLHLPHEAGRTHIFQTLTAPAEMKQQIHPTYRYDLRRTEEKVSLLNGRQSSKDRLRLVDAFMALYQENMSHRQASKTYDFSHKTLMSLVNMPHSVCWGVEQDGSIIAVSIFVSNGQEGVYFCNAATDEGRQYGKLLVWKSLEELQTQGVAFVNLGGGITEGDTLEQFKSRFGGVSHQTCAYKVVFQKNLYDQVCDVFQSKRFFPTYLQKG